MKIDSALLALSAFTVAVVGLLQPRRPVSASSPPRSPASSGASQAPAVPENDQHHHEIKQHHSEENKQQHAEES